MTCAGPRSPPARRTCPTELGSPGGNGLSPRADAYLEETPRGFDLEPIRPDRGEYAYPVVTVTVPCIVGRSIFDEVRPFYGLRASYDIDTLMATVTGEAAELDAFLAARTL